MTNVYELCGTYQAATGPAGPVPLNRKTTSQRAKEGSGEVPKRRRPLEFERKLPPAMFLHPRQLRRRTSRD